MTSLFSKIVRGELPAERIYETATELAFLDINPKSPGHALVVPKREVANFEDLPPADARALIGTVQVVVRAVTAAMETPHYNLALNNGAPAGQVIFHVHFHVIPRYGGLPASRAKAAGEGLAEIGARIRQAVAQLPPAAE